MKAALLTALLLAFGAKAQAEFGGYAGTHLGFGGEGIEGSEPYAKRTVGALDIQAMPGWHFYGKTLLAGLLFDFRLLSQLSRVESTTVNGDFGGTGLTVGPGVLADFTSVIFLFSYDMRDRQSLNGPDATLKGSGFHFLLGYRPWGRLSFDVEYVISHYNAMSIAGAENGLGDFPFSQHNLGVGISVTL